ncbi:MAG: hypothetical protein J7M24_00370 [Candidatus Latescibacteria bacterium]|nr:hypothetical protein [Candidatus Latescibacterota bacterium]
MGRKTKKNSNKQKRGHGQPVNIVPSGIKKLATGAHPLLTALVLTAILFAVQGIFFASSFQTNDDIGMLFIASGHGSSMEPDEHLRYSHVILGFILKKLFTITQEVPWYGIYHFFVHFLSMAALAYAVLDRSRSMKRIAFLLLYFGFVELFYLNNIQFTITSCIAAQSGVFLFMSGLHKETYGRWGMLAASFLLLLVSFLVRANGFFLMMLVSLPVMALILWEERRNRSSAAVFLGFWLVVGVTVFGLREYEKQYYNNDPAWEHFFEFSSLKSSFVDYKHIEYTKETKAVFDEVGWSRNDLDMMRSWFHADEDLYSIENLRKITSRFPSYKTYLSFRQVVSIVLKKILTQKFFVLLAAFFMLYMQGGEKGNRGKILSALVFMLAVIAYLIVTKRLPNRVLQPMLSFFILTVLYFNTRDIGSFSSIRRIINTVFIIILAFALSGFLIGQLHEVKTKKMDNLGLKQTVRELGPSADQLYVVWGASVPWENISQFDTLDFIRDWKLIILGTTLRTPITKKRMKQFGIDNIYRALFEKDNVFLVVRNNRYLNYYKQFVREHYNTPITFENTFRSPDFNVVRVTSK